MTREHANLLANLAEDIAGAQMSLDAGLGEQAKAYAQEAVARFNERSGVAKARINVAIGRITAVVDNGDQTETTFIARRFGE